MEWLQGLFCKVGAWRELWASLVPCNQVTTECVLVGWCQPGELPSVEKQLWEEQLWLCSPLEVVVILSSCLITTPFK